MVETDASDFAVGMVIFQLQDDHKLHPIAFYSRKFTSSEINYDTHDKELLAIVVAFSQWRHYFEGNPHKIRVYSDHRNLIHFMDSTVPNRRQARWSMIL